MSYAHRAGKHIVKDTRNQCVFETYTKNSSMQNNVYTLPLIQMCNQF
jgi:hypothetical protein